MDDVLEYVLNNQNRLLSEYNRRKGYDTVQNRVMSEQYLRANLAMLSRASGGGKITLRRFIEVVEERLAPLRDVVLKAEKEKPSISRFEAVAAALEKAAYDSARTQDSLCELNGWFSRGLQLLSERPKVPEKVENRTDLHLTKPEFLRIFMASVRLGTAIAEYGRELSHLAVIDTPIDASLIPKSLRSSVESASKESDVTKRVIRLVVSLFERVDEDHLRYNGKLFQFMSFLSSHAPTLNEDAMSLLHNKSMAPLLDMNLLSIADLPLYRSMVTTIVATNNAHPGRYVEARAEQALIRQEIAQASARERQALSPPPAPETESAAEPVIEPAKSKLGTHYSIFHGQTIGPAIGKKISVGRDGITFSCPTQVDGRVVTREYVIKGELQLRFTDGLIAAYRNDAQGWWKPPSTQKSWQSRYFKRGDARQFLHDHIVSRTAPEGGYTGEIRLKIP